MNNLSWSAVDKNKQPEENSTVLLSEGQALPNE